jgi:hypothetical protein
MWPFIKQGETLIVYSITDPALDLEQSKIDEYQDTLDASFLVFREGRTPVGWVLRTIDTFEYKGNIGAAVGNATLNAQGGASVPLQQAELHIRHFRTGVSDVTPAPGDDAGPIGVAYRAWQETGKMPDDFVRLTPYPIIMELSEYIALKHRGVDGLGK